MAKIHRSIVAKPKPQRAAVPVFTKRVTEVPPRSSIGHESLFADDPWALTEADAPAAGAKDNWRTPLENDGLSFDDLSKLVLSDPEKTAAICQATVKFDHLGYWDTVYRVIALGMLWARHLQTDDAAWEAFQARSFWSSRSAMSRKRVLSYCLMFLYGSHQGNPAHRANAHARAVENEFADPNFKPRDLPRCLFLRGGLEAKADALPKRKDSQAPKSNGGRGMASNVGRGGTGVNDSVVCSADLNRTGRGSQQGIDPPRPLLPQSEDNSLAAALFRYAWDLSLEAGQDLHIKVHRDELDLDNSFEFSHVISSPDDDA